MKRLSIFVTAVILAVALFGSANTTRAYAYYLSYGGLQAGSTCSNTGITAYVTYSDNLPGGGPGTYSYTDTLTASGVTQPYSGSYNYIVGGSSGTLGISYTFPANVPYPYTVSEYESVNVGGTVIYASVTASCNNGTLTITGSSSGINTSGNIPGPGIPAGYTLHTVVCNTAVYDAAGGKAIAGNSITSGQTWFISPTSVKGTDGRQWSAAFVGSANVVYILTSCVR